MPIGKAAICLIAILLLTNCTSPTEPSDYEFGRADVFVRNMAGQPIDGVPVRLDRLNGETEDAGGLTGTAGSPGFYFFLKTQGDYRIVITPPAGYALAEGQSATAPVSFKKDQAVTVNFVLRPL